MSCSSCIYLYAEKRLRHEEQYALKIGSSRLTSVANAGLIYLEKLKKRQPELKRTAEHKLRDDLYRQRFVKLSNE
jgi:hypothetical protein